MMFGCGTVFAFCGHEHCCVELVVLHPPNFPSHSLASCAQVLQLIPQDVKKGFGRNALHIAAWKVPTHALGTDVHHGVVEILIREAGSVRRISDGWFG